MSAVAPTVGASRILVVDLEATCAKDGSILAANVEIIEIGAVWVTPEGELLDQFERVIRPVLHPILSPFCKQLTGIDQQDVDAACTLGPVLDEFEGWLAESAPQGEEPPAWMSWSDWDSRQLKLDAGRLERPSPLAGWQHYDAKKLFGRSQRIQPTPGLSRAVKLAGLTLDGKHHRGLDDARNTARLMPWILGLQQLPIPVSPTPPSNPVAPDSPAE